jgi:imidazolonepropionase-like amidohydrolase
VAAGFPRAQALKAITVDAARSSGLPELLGRIRAGGPADFVIWSGSPLDLKAKPLAVVVDGKRVGGDDSE